MIARPWVWALSCALWAAGGAGAAPATGTVQHLTSPSQQADNLFRAAWQSVQQGHMQTAHALLTQALDAQAEHHEARLLLAALTLEQGDTAAVIRLLTEGLNRAPGHLPLAMALAQMQLHRGDVPSAVTGLQSSLQHHGSKAPPLAEFSALLATLLQRQGRHPEATPHYLAALQQKPEQAAWWLGLGLALQAQQQHTHALQAYQRGLALGLPAALALWAESAQSSALAAASAEPAAAQQRDVPPTHPGP